ncbi:MAG: YkgJ family cysteine cluster protein [Promethearchaeati archaeon]
MKTLKYQCMKCGSCCYEIPGEYSKRIPLYPDEVDRLIKIAQKRDINFKVIEDLVFPDILNQKIIVLTYKIKFENETQSCPFYSKNEGCKIQNVKPIACKAYPLSLKQEDAFNFQISIDPLCKFVSKEENYNRLKKLDWKSIKEVFKDEYRNAEEHLKKNKKLMLKIRRLETDKKINISRKISLDDFNKSLQNWERVEICVE